MTLSEFAEALGFTQRWFELQVVDADKLNAMKKYWDTGKDDNTEHYRYWAFREFLKANSPLSAELAEALFQLGDNDPDYGMGGSMMADVVRSRDCPEVVMNLAYRSNRPHLLKILQRRNFTAPG